MRIRLYQGSPECQDVHDLTHSGLFRLTRRGAQSATEDMPDCMTSELAITRDLRPLRQVYVPIQRHLSLPEAVMNRMMRRELRWSKITPM